MIVSMLFAFPGKSYPGRSAWVCKLPLLPLGLLISLPWLQRQFRWVGYVDV